MSNNLAKILFQKKLLNKSHAFNGHLIEAKHYVKCFPDTISFNPPRHLVKETLFIPINLMRK